MDKVKYSLKATNVFLATDDSRIQEVAKKIGIVLPSTHTVLFQSVYAPLETANDNGVRLATSTVADLPGLIGSQANLNHYGYGWIVGTILDAWVDATTQEINIIFSFAKNIYQEEYVMALEAMGQGKLTVSFELMADNANIQTLDDGTIRCTKVDYQGVGVLIGKTPAYKKAKVYQMAERCKERAKNCGQELLIASQILESCDKALSTKENKMEADSQPSMTDMMPMGTCKCPYCYEDMNSDTLLKDVYGDIYHKPCMNMGAIYVPSFMKAEDMVLQSAKWTRKYINSLPDSSFAVIEPAFKDGKTDNKNARHLPYKDANGKIDLPHYRNALARANQIIPVTDSITTEELRSRAMNELNKHKDVLKKADEDNNQKDQGGQTMTDEQKKMVANIRAELAGYIPQEAKDEDLLIDEKVAEYRKAKSDAEAKAKEEKELAEKSATEKVEAEKATADKVSALEAENTELKTTVENQKKELDAFKAEAEARKAKELADKLAQLKADLKDNQFCKEFKDEDYLDEAKVKEAKILKENADLKVKVEALEKAGKVEVKAEAKKDDLSTGAEGKASEEATIGSIFKTARNRQE